MLKIEKKIFEWVDKYRLLLSFLLVNALTLYLRKIGVWWSFSDVAAAFDMHENYIESSMYHLLVRFVQYVPILPLHSIKWLAGLCDYILVFLCVCSMEASVKKWREREVITYTLLIFSPVLYIRGIIWGQIDSVAMVFVVLAYLLWKGRKFMVALISAVVACALYPCLLPVVVLYLFLADQERCFFATVWIIVGTVLLLGICSLILGNSFLEGVETLLRWGTFNAVDGTLFTFGADWLWQILILYGLPISIVLLMGTLQGKVSYKWLVLSQILVTILYGRMIFLEKLY